MVELQKKINSDDQVRAVGTGDSRTGFYINRFGNRTLVVRSTSSLSLAVSLYTHTHTHICEEFFNESQFVWKFIYIQREREIYTQYLLALPKLKAKTIVVTIKSSLSVSIEFLFEFG